MMNVTVAHHVSGEYIFCFRDVGSRLWRLLMDVFNKQLNLLIGDFCYAFTPFDIYSGQHWLYCLSEVGPGGSSLFCLRFPLKDSELRQSFQSFLLSAHRGHYWNVVRCSQPIDVNVLLPDNGACSECTAAWSECFYQSTDALLSTARSETNNLLILGSCGLV